MKKAHKIRTWKDRCHYRGDVSKCPICKDGPERAPKTLGRDSVFVTECQLYDIAGMGPRGTRRTIVILIAAAIAGVAVSQLVKLLAG
jgi:hypothetical protein